MGGKKWRQRNGRKGKGKGGREKGLDFSLAKVPVGAHAIKDITIQYNTIY